VAAKKKTINSNRKLLSAWEPPEGAGLPVGCVATTFTFSPVFFEEECLSRFLQMQSDALQDGPVYIIEREEKLADVRCASVLVDAAHAKGSRSLRWDLLTANVPKAILHSKVSLLCWLNCIRVIVASANLTDDGYRRNQEIYGVVDFFDGSDAPTQFLGDIIDFLRQAVTYANSGSGEAPPAIVRWNGFLDTISEMSPTWGNPNEVKGRKDIRLHAVLTGPGRTDALEQIMALWPEGAQPINAHVTSPFFDPPGTPNQPARALWSRLRKRGDVSVTYNLGVDQDPDEGVIALRAPKEIMDAEPERDGATTILCQLTEQGEGEDAVFRPLHLKSLLFEGKDWDADLIGSGNFTSRGLGLAKSPNMEAHILYLVNRVGNPSAAKALARSILQGVPIDDSFKLKWVPPSDAGEDEADQEALVLPTAFGAATFTHKDKHDFIQLEFAGRPPAGWQVVWNSDRDKLILDEHAWENQQTPDKVRLEWTEAMPPSGFDVIWRGTSGRAWWPVNVDRAASLPPPDELKDLPLDLLINVLTSARPLHQVLRNWLKVKDRSLNPIKGNEIIDPHKRVDTSSFLLQKTYRVTAALNGLRTRLERPAMSLDAIEWRLKGPVGVTAVQKAILKEAQSVDEQVFLLTELALELSRATPRTAPGCLGVKEINQQIREVMADLKSEAMTRLGNAPQALKDYVRSAFQEVFP
jgi:hypothetical protein